MSGRGQGRGRSWPHRTARARRPPPGRGRSRPAVPAAGRDARWRRRRRAAILPATRKPRRDSTRGRTSPENDSAVLPASARTCSSRTGVPPRPAPVACRSRKPARQAGHGQGEQPAGHAAGAAWRRRRDFPATQQKETGQTSTSAAASGPDKTLAWVSFRSETGHERARLAAAPAAVGRTAGEAGPHN